MSQLLIWCCFFSRRCHDNSSTAPFISAGPGLHCWPSADSGAARGASLNPSLRYIWHCYLLFSLWFALRKGQIKLRHRKKLWKFFISPSGEACSLHLLQHPGRKGSSMPRDLRKRERSVSVRCSETTLTPAPWGQRGCRSDAC